MISAKDQIRRITSADETLTELIRKALQDNFLRIPFTRHGGWIVTELGVPDIKADRLIVISGYCTESGTMMQQVTIVSFPTEDRADHFRHSPEGRGFDSYWGDGKDILDCEFLAGDPRLPERLATILKTHFGFRDNSKLCAHTQCQSCGPVGIDGEDGVKGVVS